MQMTMRIAGNAAALCLAGILLLTRGPGVQAADLNPPVSDSPAVLDLETAIRTALSDNPGIAAARDRIRQARARLAQARSVFWPRISATASGSRIFLADRTLEKQQAQARFVNPMATIDDPEDYYRLGLSATWLVFNGFERKWTHRTAQLGVVLSDTARQEIQRQLIAAVARTYYGVQLARENLTIARADADFNRRLLDEAAIRLRVGTGALSDKLNFQIRVNMARASEIKAKESFDAVRYSLAALLGFADARWPDHLTIAPLPPEKDTELRLPDIETLITYSLSHRPDMILHHLARKQAALAVKTARAGYYPSVNLSAAVNGERPEDASFDHADFGKTLSIGLSYNLFAGGLTRARVDAASARLAETTREEADTRLTAAARVRAAHVQLTAARRQLMLQRDNTRLVQDRRDLVEKEYAAGQAPLVRLNEAQRDLIAARSRLALALVSLRQAWIDLKTETGRSLEDFPLESP